ncbi:N-acetyl-1-D-myo-inositol-2-amino-2-deoxy-alpha-D-glucopyranoside deacetylase [Modestobacter sp. I12A-02628]|uniref:1D-myo-inositol 2-acetamido-2-deoxy-alpha-D-glucopyranoside deacetylase n=1 Tax=Goekera deserti TaxID=2497753 RepID=A0A7K3WCK3_9ACTN|nr:N-acetyl-1-D-myo-inositol-2-amino-2-deoxy-alpha-D-glucopyranoside deacetylase [Goekera deserti]MPQ98544.1 N-acetyl-1-D-myo-inositol-2-amino-2-deoxy-alpha-D-glucopyranoside deacetylase [Goekera deserti]NDI49085.1 N-acetyl-1-D-myo-inositol-2-amino-2-deoxy-alpha-D-glucopyranoside deacetylase [Goekera deserti]NEL54124.1 N-acetyl-1-D-myo-inositol-2-amino-2-deoxy-alpha-D-glucopyranoside deacetylase [Goekera deserti]
MIPDRRLLLVHAHPDDETINNGATMARYAAEGVGVTLLTCTLGEEGEVIPDELRQLAADHADQLGGYRIGELAEAMAHLGVTDHRWLGGAGRWRDSGMLHTPPNEHPRAFWRADPAEAVAAVVAVLREVRPQVVVTYDENGGYGHPDHVQAHRVTMAAVDAAADPAAHPTLGAPWQVSKVYWTCLPVSVLRRGQQALAEAGQETGFAIALDAGELGDATADELVTAEVDGEAFRAHKEAAMRAHATQITVRGSFFALSNGLGQELLATEHYRLARGEPGVAQGREQDLFTGIDPA